MKTDLFSRAAKGQKPAPAPPRPEAAPPIASVQNALINILIVDDEPKNLTVLETVLDNPGYRLVRAASADEALLALVVEEFALIILDIRMPGMTGLDLAQLIKERKKTAGVPIIFLTAYYNEDQHVLEGYGTGAVDYLHKPVNAAVLRSKVAVFAELHRKSRESTAANRALLAEVTERRRAEEQLRELNETLDQRVIARSEALREREEQLRLFAEHAPAAIAMFDAQMCFLAGSQRWLAEHGLQGQDLRGRGYYEIFPETPERWKEIHRRCLAGAVEGMQEDRSERADGVTQWLRWEIRPWHGAAETVGGVIIFIEDITERRQNEAALRAAKEEAEAANRSKDRFLAMLSHELRTPLTPALMVAENLQQDDTLPAETRKQIGIIKRNIDLEARLLDDLLDMTAISKGKLRLRSEWCDAHSLIGLAIHIVKDAALNKEIDIECDLAASLHGFWGDPPRFQQVLWNVLSNAVKFTPKGGRILARTSNRIGEDGRPWLNIDVSDSGIGIDPAALERIFLPFEQEDAIGNYRFGGIGLGLAIARAIVELHGGRISARSEGANHGATFAVELPGVSAIADRNVDLPASSPPPEQDGTVRPDTSEPSETVRSILLVEDHSMTLESVSSILRRWGYKVVTATNVTDAFKAAATQTFDLVISDLGLPDGTGIELMEKLRSEYGLRGIAFSGYGMEEDIARSKAAGFVAHLVKPIHLAELRRLLKESPGTISPAP